MQTTHLEEIKVPSLRNRLMATAFNTFVLRRGEFSIKKSILSYITSELEKEKILLENMNRNAKGRVSDAELNEMKAAIRAAESMELTFKK